MKLIIFAGNLWNKSKINPGFYLLKLSSYVKVEYAIKVEYSMITASKHRQALEM